ncbi:MAG: hypothetical protein JST00_22020 [Deltaproteobacteria bacterium]|nr:hypothetical protein [Deltaproteobacteria bacterium]
MSVEYWVTSPSPLPRRDDDWSFAVGPVAVSRSSDDDLRALVKEALGPDAVIADLVVFSSRAGGADVGFELAQLAGKSLGGAVLYEDGPEVVARFAAPSVAVDPRGLEQAMTQLWTDARAREEAEKARAKTDWDARLEQDPTLRRDSDWSNL